MSIEYPLSQNGQFSEQNPLDGNKEFDNFLKAKKLISYQEEYVPDAEQVKIYESKYKVFKELYPA